jgi:4-amino-4-deoxy-L-arabinose transferase-like glycosyltransferase
MIQNFRHRGWVYLLIFVMYAYGLGWYSVPLTGDQKTYVSIAMEMRQRIEWLIPYLFDTPNFLKPPLQYWATLVGWKIFGFNLWGALMPSVFALLFSGYWVSRISKSKSSLPVAAFAATIGTLTYGTTAQMEIWIVLFYLWSWTWWLEGKTTRALLICGLMSLIKGPLYPVLFVLSIILESILRKNRDRIFNVRFLGSLLLGVIVGLSWYFLVATTPSRDALLNQFLKRENMGKISTPHGTPWGLWGEFFFTLFPIMVLVFFSFFTEEFKSAWSQNKRFWISYALIPALFFTFFPYRVNTYLYLLTPLAVWILVECEPGLTRFKTKMFYASGAFGLPLILMAFRLAAGSWFRMELGALLILATLAWVWFHARGKAGGVVLCSLFMVNLIRLGAVEMGERDLHGLREYRSAHPGGQLAYVMTEEDIWHEYGTISAALGEVIPVYRDLEKARNGLQRGYSLILSDEQIGIATGLQCLPWTRSKKRIKFPISKLLFHGLSVGDSDLVRTYQICHI